MTIKAYKGVRNKLNTLYNCIIIIIYIFTDDHQVVVFIHIAKPKKPPALTFSSTLLGKNVLFNELI